jgi:hypothetical protein
MYDHTDAFRL